MKLRIGSRGSRLALWQANHVKDLLEAGHPGLEVEITILRTTGDRITDVPLAKIGDKGLFTKELDRAILDGEIDAAVHSLKDVPTRLVDGLALGAILERIDAADVLVPAPGRPASLDEMPAGARIGTSSLRRRAQLNHLRPDLVVEDLRGNLDTRMQRLREGRYDAAILAWAGVQRLGFDELVGERLEAPDWLPAVGQGALGIALREDDERTRTVVGTLNHAISASETAAERAFLRRLEGGCQIPIGALARIRDGRLHLQGFVAELDGEPLLRDEIEGSPDDAETLGRSLAERLLERGADEVLRAVRARFDGHPPAAPAP